MVDPMKVAQQQMDMNLNAARESALLNQVNQWTPWGGTYWTGDIGSPDRTQHTVYNPMLGRILFGDTYHPHFGGGMGAGPNLGGLFGGMFGGGRDDGAWWRDTPDESRNGRSSSPDPSRYDYGGGESPDTVDFDMDVPEYTGPLAEMLAAAYGQIPGQLLGMKKSFRDFLKSIPKAASNIGKSQADIVAGNVAAGDYGTFGNVYGGLGDIGHGADMSAPSASDRADPMSAAAFGAMEGGDFGAPDTGGGPGGGDYGAEQGGAMFKDGGFTGLGADGILQRERPAGIAHEGEFILSTPMLAEILARAQMGGIGENLPMMMPQLGDMYSSANAPHGAGAGYAPPSPAVTVGGMDMMGAPASEQQPPMATPEEILARTQMGNPLSGVTDDLAERLRLEAAQMGMPNPGETIRQGYDDVMGGGGDIGNALIQALSGMGTAAGGAMGDASDELRRAMREAGMWARQKGAEVDLPDPEGALTEILSRARMMMPSLNLR